MNTDERKCSSGGCPRPATTIITFTDGHKARYCQRCTKKINPPAEACRPITASR